MNKHESSRSIHDQQAWLAARELSSFIAAVTELHGAEQSRLAASDWLDEFERMHAAPQLDVRGLRAVTIAASARLATRMNVGVNRRRQPDTLATEG